MRVLNTIGLAATVLSSIASAAQWTFADDATLQVATKGAESEKLKFTPNKPVTSPVPLSASTTLKVLLTAQEGKSAKRPHQAFLTLREIETGLEESFAFNVKENGKANINIAQKDLPFQFLTTSKPIQASIVLGSFGSSTAYNAPAFLITVQPDANNPVSKPDAPERYTSKPEIHHIFKSDPRSPPTVVSLVFTLAVLATLPVLLGAWLFLGGNIDHASKAFGAQPVAHGLFYGSIVAMEGVFFLYYSSWNLFQTLPVAAVVGIVAFVSGSRALTEVQERRLAGER